MQKRVTFKNSKGQRLVGVLQIPNQKTNKAVIVCHGFTANKDRKRLVKVSTSLTKNGLTALRFDFGGSGQSQKRPITLKAQVDDLKSAINFLRKEGYRSIGLLGESFGGLTVIKTYSKRIQSIVLWAPVTTPSFSKFSKESIVKELEKNRFLKLKKDNRIFIIPRKYLKERLSFNQKDILSKISIPALVIHGDKDDDVPLGHSKRAIKYLSKGSKLTIIKGGDHKMDNKMDKVIPLTVDWFKKYL